MKLRKMLGHLGLLYLMFVAGLALLPHTTVTMSRPSLRNWSRK